jgi:hypothetical protein
MVAFVLSLCLVKAYLLDVKTWAMPEITISKIQGFYVSRVGKRNGWRYVLKISHWNITNITIFSNEKNHKWIKFIIKGSSYCSIQKLWILILSWLM